jgi:predicted regulator of Ras-like GTPase activity (Roadblock/LC7/MglB family)
MLETLNEQQSQALSDLLSGYLRKAEGRAVYFCDCGGNIISQESEKEIDHCENMVALCAGAFFATREVARFVGEEEFETVSQRGKTSSLYMQIVYGDMLLMVVFGSESNHGLIKFRTNELCRSLGKFLREVEKEAMLGGNTEPATQFEIDLSADAFKMA